ncbi:MAG TPA: hypothetical protein VM369_03175 [Candidatus Binatia bacterium]|nr:hypothetical protein [Candidatus Binatia bacterium]
MSEHDRIPGLEQLRRARAPGRDLWPGIESRLRPRGRRGQWLPLAAAASVAVAALATLLSLPHAPGLVEGIAGGPLPLSSDSRAIVTANLAIAGNAERQLQEALRRAPESAALQALLVSTRQRQHELRRLMASA